MSKEDVYNVEKIINSRVQNGKKQYFIKWEGYSEEHNTWEYKKDIFCKDLINAYEASQKKSPGKAKRKARNSVTSIDENPENNETKSSLPRKSRSSAENKGKPDSESWEDMIDEVLTVQWNTAAQRLDVQFKMSNGNIGVVPSTEAHIHFPIALIRFYEKHISFQSDSEDEEKKVAD